MIFRQLLNEPIAAASYLLGCTTSGEAAVIDPGLPAEQYALIAADKGLRIRYILETHLHADYFSTGRALAELTGARIVLPRQAEARFEHNTLDDGNQIKLGNLVITALHTPGHTPEHTCYLVADTHRATRPWFVFTGDCLFVGDVGRADLADLPLSGPDVLYTSIFDKLLKLHDDVEIFPAHYGGSACGGRAMSGKASSTIGFERRFNWALQAPDRQTFVSWINEAPHAAVEGVLLHRHTNQGLLPLPAAYGDAPLAPAKRIDVPAVSLHHMAVAMRAGAALIDVRPIEAFLECHVQGALCVPFSRDALAERVAAVARPGEPILVLADQAIVAAEAAGILASTGRNPVGGHITTTPNDWAAAGFSSTKLEAIDVEELHRHANKGSAVLDVRDPYEWEQGVIPGAITISHDQLRDRLHDVPARQLICVVCESGLRAAIAAALLHRYGRQDLAVVVAEGMSDYAARYPVARVI